MHQYTVLVFFFLAYFTLYIKKNTFESVLMRQMKLEPIIHSFFFFFNSIGIQLTYKVVLVSNIQQKDSVMYIFLLFQILFPYSLLQNIEFPVLLQYVLVGYLCYIWQYMYVNLRLLIYDFLPYFSVGSHKCDLKACESVSIL